MNSYSTVAHHGAGAPRESHAKRPLHVAVGLLGVLPPLLAGYVAIRFGSQPQPTPLPMANSVEVDIVPAALLFCGVWAMLLRRIRQSVEYQQRR